jgi:hypothetical protein
VREKKGRLGEIGGSWLSKRRGSWAWCRTWFDRATRQTCRASRGTEDLDDAKLALAAWVRANGRIERKHPEDAFAETRFVRYYERHARHQASGEQARYGVKLWSEYFPGALVSELTLDKQRRFVAWLRGRG